MAGSKEKVIALPSGGGEEWVRAVALVDASGNQIGGIAAGVGTAGSLTAAQATIGTPVAGGTASATITGASETLISLQGTYAGVTVAVELSDDSGTTWYPSPFAVLVSNGAAVAALPVASQALTNNGQYLLLVPTFGATTVRVRASAYTSGTVNVRLTPAGSTSLLPHLAGSAALADGTANPSAAFFAALGLVWNGATWDRWSSASTDSILGAGKVMLMLRGGQRVGDGANATDGANGAQAMWGIPSLWNGATYDRSRVANVIKTIAAVAITAGTAATIWTPTAGKKFRLMGWSLSSSAAAALIFQFGGTPTTMFRTELLAAAGISQSAPNFGNGTMPGVANDVLKLDVTATSTVSGYIFGTEE